MPLLPRPRAVPRTLCAAAIVLAVPGLAFAQDHVHTPGMTHAAARPTQGGQAAFAALQEVVALLAADPTTDWRVVNVERLRRHLIDMDLVTMQSAVTMVPLADGARFTVRGTGPTIAAIQRMTTAHAGMVAADTTAPRMAVSRIADGAIVTVRARTPGDPQAVARIRGLGFIGLLAEGDHHAAHHLALARGDTMADHGHR